MCTREIQRIIKIITNKLINLYTSKMDNIKEMGKLLEIYNFPRQIQKKVENVNRPIPSN